MTGHQYDKGMYMLVGNANGGKSMLFKVVEAMLKVAAGERIEWDQEELLRIRGWAIESRVYAEDPARDFMPAVGQLTAYREPPGELLGCGVRVDAGVAEGDEIDVRISVHSGKCFCQVSTCIKRSPD